MLVSGEGTLSGFGFTIWFPKMLRTRTHTGWEVGCWVNCLNWGGEFYFFGKRIQKKYKIDGSASSFGQLGHVWWLLLAGFYCNVRWNRLFFGMFFFVCVCVCLSVFVFVLEIEEPDSDDDDDVDVDDDHCHQHCETWMLVHASPGFCQASASSGGMQRPGTAQAPLLGNLRTWKHMKRIVLLLLIFEDHFWPVTSMCGCCW